MEAHKISVKFFAEDGSKIGHGDVLPVFHSWIQTQAVADHLLIDVADYQHVTDGPGTVLVAHEANFSTDRGEERLGLMYFRKQPAGETFGDRLRQAISAALEGCVRLEKDPRLEGRIRFGTDEIQVRIHDRLAAPNTVETFAAVAAEIEAVGRELYGPAAVSIEHKGNAQSLFEVRIKAASSPAAVKLLGRLPASSRS
jgi:hypothetical protein